MILCPNISAKIMTLTFKNGFKQGIPLNSINVATYGEVQKKDIALVLDFMLK